jgi:serine/threonine protein kinase
MGPYHRFQLNNLKFRVHKKSSMEIIIANRFHLGKKLGEGGFAEVFEAVDSKTNEKCA